MDRDDALRRVVTKGHRMPPDRAIRAAGVAVLAVGALAAWWLYRAVNRPPAHPATATELVAGAVVFLSWACGWAAIGEGGGLFRRVSVPGRQGPIELEHAGNGQ